MQSFREPEVTLKMLPVVLVTGNQGDDWRIYSTYDEKMQSTIIVAELYNIRRELADDIARSNANILLVTYPVFGLLVWFLISLALRSITASPLKFQVVPPLILNLCN